MTRELEIVLNGGSAPALNNATSNPQVNIPTSYPNNIVPLTDSIIDLGIHSIKKDRPSDAFIVNNKNFIMSLMETYKLELNDETSKIYKLFSFLLNEMKDDKYILISIFFRSIEKKLFSIEDMFVFLENTNNSLSVESLVKFMTSIKKEKAAIIKKRLTREVDETYGNFFNFINNAFNALDGSLFYHEEIEATEFFKDKKDYLLIPLINYFTFNDEEYRTIREAEEDYWDIISNSEILDTPFSLPIVNQMWEIINNREYKKKVFGIPVLMRKQFQKLLYFDNFKLDELFLSILKKSYKNFSYKEIDNFINRMCLELVDFYLENSVNFNYSISSNQLPDLSIFFTSKVDQLLNLEITELEIVKEIKFYLNLVCNYLRLTSIDLEDLNTLIDDEFDDFRNKILELRDLLLVEGKFET